VQRTIATDGTVFGKPLVDPVSKSVYFATTGGWAYRVPFPADGTGGVRRFKLRGPVEAGVTVADSRLIVATTGGVVQALNVANGHELWSRQLARTGNGSGPSAGVFLTPAASAATATLRGQVVVASADCRVTAIDDKGGLVWQSRFYRPVSSAPVLVGDVVITTTTDSVDVLLMAKFPPTQIIRSYCTVDVPKLGRCTNDIRPTSLSEDGTQVLVGLRSGQLEGMKYESLTPVEKAAAAKPTTTP
jgi:outer membrane protein assembly factor BamB